MKRTPQIFKPIQHLHLFHELHRLDIDPNIRLRALKDLIITLQKNRLDIDTSNIDASFSWDQTKEGWVFWKRLRNIQLKQPINYDIPQYCLEREQYDSL